MRLFVQVVVFFVVVIYATLSNAQKVVVTIEPQRYFVEKIAGGLLNVVTIVPPNADLHTYEIKPSQVKAIEDAKIYFTIGDPIEEALIPKIKAVNKNLIVVKTDENIEKIPSDPHHHHHHHKHPCPHKEKSSTSSTCPHHHLDPHIWLSPSNVKTIALNIKESLITHMPQHKDTFTENYNKFIQEVDGLHAKISEILTNLPDNKRKFLIYHPSLTYFARDYNLLQIAIEDMGKEPSPKKLQRIIKFAKENNLKKIFTQSQVSSKTIDVLAKELNAQVIPIDPLSYNWGENLLDIAKKIAQ